MIYAELKNYLMQSAGEQTCALISRAIDVLQKFDPENDFMNEYDTVVTDNIVYFDTTLVDSIVEFTNTLMDSLLSAHSVFVTQTATLQNKTEIGEALYLIQNWNNKEEIEIALETQGNTLEKFCSVLAIVSSKTVEHFLTIVDKVDPAIITKIREEVLYPLEEEIVDVEAIKTNIIDYQRVKKIYPEPNKLDDLLKYPSAIGRPFKDYLQSWLQRFNDDLTQDLSANMLKIIACDVLLMSALSQEGLSKAQQNLSSNISMIATNLTDTAKLTAAVTQSLLEVSRA